MGGRSPLWSYYFAADSFHVFQNLDPYLQLLLAFCVCYHSTNMLHDWGTAALDGLDGSQKGGMFTNNDLIWGRVWRELLPEKPRSIRYHLVAVLVISTLPCRIHV